MVPALTSFTVSRSADGIAMPKKNPFSVHPGILMMQQWVKTLPEKTGRSLDQWIQLVKREGPPTTSERRAWLKKDHQLGTNIAATIVERAEGRGEVEASAAAYLDAAPGLVEAMFAGPKSHLRPIFDDILAFGLSLGKDVRVSPGRTIVPFYRNHVFAQVKPTTRTRIDLGFCLRGVRPQGRLLDTGGEKKGDRITHRIPIGDVSQFDQNARDWMKRAYTADARSS